MSKLGAIGECMLEFREAERGNFRLGYGGDVFNTAVYAVRLGLDVGFFSAVGDDHYSSWLLNAWRNEGVGCDDVLVLPGASPSLYIIRTDAAGERRFHYWREASPAKRLLEPGAYAERLPERLSAYDLIYFSGVTLALLPPDQRGLLLDLLTHYRSGGGRVAFDPNYRPALWPGSADVVHWVDRAYAIADFALPSLDDEVAMRGLRSAEQVARHVAAAGAGEVVVKSDVKGCVAKQEDGWARFPLPELIAATDTTAAGDSFNAAYLHARLAGRSTAAAVAAGQHLAGKVVQHSGALIPRERTAARSGDALVQGSARSGGQQ